MPVTTSTLWADKQMFTFDQAQSMRVLALSGQGVVVDIFSIHNRSKRTFRLSRQGLLARVPGALLVTGDVAGSHCPAAGCGRSSTSSPIAEHSLVQQAVNERAQQGGAMPPVRVVEKKPGPRDRPIRQYPHQQSLCQQFAHTILFEVIGDSKAGQGRRNPDVSVIGDDRTVHGDLEVATSLLELPSVLPAIALQPPVDAGVILQFRGSSRCSAACQVIR